MLIELGWASLSGEEIAKRLTYRTFSAHGIAKMLDIVYGSSPDAALKAVYIRSLGRGKWRERLGPKTACMIV